MPTRRAVLLTPLALAGGEGWGANQKMQLAMHHFTSAGAGYQRSLEGWAKAGIRLVEPASNVLDAFLKTETMASAKRILADNGLTVVSGAVGVTGLWEPNPKQAENLETFRRRCAQFAELGAPLIYSPCVTAEKFTADDYKRGVENIRRAAEVARGHGLRVGAEFVRNSTFLASLPTALRLYREAAHPNFGIIFDCYHFWSGPSRLEDMDDIRPGEILHAHLNDTPEMPRELLDLQSRVVPGEGVAPLGKIVKKLVQKGYGGPISVELFWEKYQKADPYTLAAEIKKKSEAIFRRAGV